MRIISPFKDYYDSALAYGMDPAVVYRRECSERPVPEAWRNAIDELLDHHPDGLWDPYFQPQARLALVVVGNKARRIWLSDTPTPEELSSNRGKSLALDTAEARDSLRSEAREIFGATYLKEHLADLDRFVSEMAQPVEVPPSWMVELAAPAYMIPWGVKRGDRSHRAILNPRLASLGMEKHLDPFTAMQEISMVLGQRLAAEDHAPRTVGDDRDIARAKGFDDQSFRTAAPGNKKENRKANRLRKRNGTNETDPS